MYASWTMFTLGPGTRSTAEGLAGQFAPVLRGLKGFKSATFLGDEATGEYAALTVWETKADAEAAAAATKPTLAQAISGIAQAPLYFHLFEVYETKA